MYGGYPPLFLLMLRMTRRVFFHVQRRGLSAEMIMRNPITVGFLV